MRLRWTTPAADDLCRIVEYIRHDNPDKAAEVADVIYKGCDTLRRFPHIGRKGRIPDTRELVFPGLPYIVVYQVTDDAVRLLRIYHGAQDWP